MGVHGQGPVRFDFEGSLVAARRLWALADSLDTHASIRLAAAQRALTNWTGALRNEFLTRTTQEHEAITKCARECRNGALGWAIAWKNAMDEDNRRRRARAVDEVRKQRSWMERNVGDLFLGDDSMDHIPQAKEVATPKAPSFKRTAWPQQFSHGSGS